jgi:hypothetical protein
MKLGLLLLISVLTAVAQQPQASPEKATATCNIANIGTVVTINCTGLTPQQQQVLTSVPELLNKILISQGGSVSEIVSTLNICIAQGASRHLSQGQRDFIDAAVTQFKDQSINIDIYSQMKETKEFGEEMLAALKHAGLAANAVYIPYTQPKIGFWVSIGAKRQDLARPLLRALSQSRISNTAIPVNLNVTEDTLILTVGAKPQLGTKA